MTDANTPISWDFLSLVEYWNLYALPGLLVVIAALVYLGPGRGRPITASQSDARLIVGRLGLTHYLLSLSFLMAVLERLLADEASGPQILLVASLYAPALSILVNAVLGFGLRRSNRTARLAAIIWNALCSVVALISMGWIVYYGAYIDPSRWPDLFVAKVLPIFLLVFLLLPPVKNVFVHAEKEGEDVRKHRILSLLSLLALMILASTLVIDGIDWMLRLISPSDLEATITLK